MLAAVPPHYLISPRLAIHMGWDSTSATTSTVSSPTISTGSFSSPQRNVSLPAELHSPSVGVISPSKHAGKRAQSSGLKATPVSRIGPVPPPSKAPTKPLPSTWLEIQPDDEVVVCTRLADYVPTSLALVPPASLPAVLAEITIKDSRLSPSGMCTSLYLLV